MLVVVALGYLLLWVVARPADQPTGRYVGEVLGAEAVLLFSASLVLATLLRVIERLFDGLDRVAIWHRNTAIIGLVLMLLHPLFASVGSVADAGTLAPLGALLGGISRLGLVALAVWALAPTIAKARWAGPIRQLAKVSYERWLTGHRLMGLFVIAAVLHAVFVDPELRDSAPLLIAYLMVGGIGIAAYVYRELFARYFIPVYDYTVARADRVNPSTLSVALDPTSRPLTFAPGQFIVLAFGGTFAWRRHPFTIDSAPDATQLGVTIRSAGDDTKEMYDELKIGTPAKVVGPFGRFDYREGGKAQIWIAGGAGVTPFLSWVRSMDDGFDRDVVFWYSVKDASDAVSWDEIQAAAERHPTFQARLVATDKDGRLTAEKAAAGTATGKDTWVFMCGPDAMTTSLAKGFKGLGVPAGQVRFERFSIR